MSLNIFRIYYLDTILGASNLLSVSRSDWMWLEGNKIDKICPNRPRWTLIKFISNIQNSSIFFHLNFDVDDDDNSTILETQVIPSKQYNATYFHSRKKRIMLFSFSSVGRHNVAIDEQPNWISCEWILCHRRWYIFRGNGNRRFYFTSWKIQNKHYQMEYW